MGQPQPDVPIVALKNASDRLGGLSAKLLQAYQLLAAEEGLVEAAMPWTNRHREAVDLLLKIEGMLEGAAKMAVDAHREDRESLVEKQRKRSRKSYLKKLGKKAESGVEPKPRGRPRKGTQS